MNYKDGIILPRREEIEKDAPITRKDRVLDIFNDNIQVQFNQKLADWYVGFTLNDEFYNILIDLIDNCPPNFIQYLVEIILLLSDEEKEYLQAFMNEEIICKLTQKILSGLPDTKDTVQLMLNLYEQAIEEKVFEEIPRFVLDLPFNIGIYLESDTDLFLRKGNRKRNTHIVYSLYLQSLNQACLRFLNNLFKNNMIHDPEIIDELYKKYIYFSKVPVENLRGTALRGISLLANLNPEVSYSILTQYDLTQTLFSFLNPKSNPSFIQSTTLDIFVNISQSENEDLIKHFLSMGLINHLTITDRDDTFIISLCVLLSNLLLCCDEIADEVCEYGILTHISDFIKYGTFNVKLSALETLITIMKNPSFAIEYFAANDCLSEALSLMPELNDNEKAIFATCLINLFNQLQKTQNIDLLNILISEEFHDALEDIINQTEDEEENQSVISLFSLLFPPSHD